MTAEQQADWLIISAQNVAWVDSNGMVDLDTSGYDGVDEFDIFNFNTVTADYFYRIQSCRTDGSDCIWMDPGIMNRGRGRF